MLSNTKTGGGVVIGTIPFLREVHQKPHDFNRYTYIALEKFLKDAGFSRVEVQPLGKPFDVFKDMVGLFFRILKEDSSIPRWKYWVAWRLTKLLQNIFRPTYETIRGSQDYCSGYGFKAYKQI